MARVDQAESPGTSRTWKLFGGTLVGVLVIDALSKLIVSRTLGPDSDRHTIQIIPGFFELSYSSNDGIAFGLLQGGSAIVWIAVALGLLLGGVFIASEIRNATSLMAVALGLCAGGALGNILNRLVTGHVIDFVEIGRWPSFNVADSALTIGLIIILVSQLRRTLPASGEQPAG